MRFRRARFRNFRLLRNVELDFSAADGRSLTVVRAENESGKTTASVALQWVLFGDDALPRPAQEYRLHPIDWDTSSGSSVVVEAEIEFEHDYERASRTGGALSETAQFLARRTATEQLSAHSWARLSSEFQLYRKSDAGWTPLPGGGELELGDILGSHLKNLFFTDGDRALSFISAEISTSDKRKLVKGAIRDMLGFEILEKSMQRVVRAQASLRGKTGALPNADQLQAVARQLAECDDLIQREDREAASAEEDAGRISIDIAAVRQKIEAALIRGDREEMVRQRKRLEEALQNSRESLARLRMSHGAIFRKRPIPLQLVAERLGRASKLLEQLRSQGKIPRTALPILRERLAHGECICGTALAPGSAARARVEKTIADQLATSAVDDRLTELRIQAAQFLSNDGAVEAWSDELKQVTAARDEAERRIADLEAELKPIEKQIDEIPDTDVPYLRAREREFIEARDAALTRATRAETNARNAKKRRDEFDAEYKGLMKQSKDSARLEAKLSAAEDIAGVLKRAFAAIEAKEIPEVGRRMNDYFLDMIGADAIRSTIRSASITSEYEILVSGPEGRSLDTDRDLNGASRRALTFSFILAITEVSGVKAPNVIDTPLGMMSPQIKRAALRIAAQRSSQLVLFLTRSEIRDVEDLLDKYAGRISTLTNTSHWPKLIKHQHGSAGVTSVRCDCSHRQYCDVCERLDDSSSPDLSRRAK